jgi:hypothetical protein
LVAQRGKSKRWLPGKKPRRTQTSFALPALDQQAVVRQAEDEQNRHAVAVAVAAAAAADAAVAAAHAAAEVVRLAGSRSRQHEQAAVAIQSAHRGYLVTFTGPRFLVACRRVQRSADGKKTGVGLRLVVRCAR